MEIENSASCAAVDVPPTLATLLPNPSPPADAPPPTGTKAKEPRAPLAGWPSRERVTPTTHACGSSSKRDSVRPRDALLLPVTDASKLDGRATTVANSPARELATQTKHYAATAAVTEVPSIGARRPTY